MSAEWSGLRRRRLHDLSQAFDDADVGGPPGGDDAAEQADAGGERDARTAPCARGCRTCPSPGSTVLRSTDANSNLAAEAADDAAQQADGDRLGEEHPQDGRLR